MKKVTITIDDDIWEWWKDNTWINLSQLAERDLKRLKALEERVLGTCPDCGSEKLHFDGKTYRCAKCGFVYKQVRRIVKKYSDKEIKCPNCHKKVKPLLELNRVKIEFIGARYTGNDKVYFQICPLCKFVISTK